MAERIARHRAQRPPAWRTLEAPLRVSEHVSATLGNAATVVVEDLTLLLSNVMADVGADAEARVEQEINELLALQAHVILVSNEVGMGLVPPYPVGRVFRDALGRINQAAAAACAEAYLVVAGVPLRLK
jgi:adenosylcobinamide kinase/adenosylcobinamide-phosphate guanylyltransferase